ncbi:patatin-like phospholipase family protein [Sphingobium nicotianae]|uniref:Patatin-like phospholipase family protein n=1 Tax=Sphingobium nicotianae TaxID=2782607 RepID=A0A9X1DDW8_9SPHN|nr:patatin-like phospholipase family protein [Sphingobium nicotianae]MBT2187758.1 patatin-like phospholipase family protein [Sphingobium nicotianae]
MMRSTLRLPALLLLALPLGACATRGPLTVDCPQFPRFVSDLPYSPLEAQIRNNWPPPQIAARPASAEEASAPVGAAAPAPVFQARPFDRSKVEAAVSSAVVEQSKRPTRSARSSSFVMLDNPSVLLLSGGGQWGAFGAGLLTSLAADDASDLPNPVAITGVSTGALQMLFVGAGLEDLDVRDALRRAYLPAKESEVVSRQSKLMVVITGAMSGLAPLRKRVEEALCPNAALASGAPCPMLDRLAASNVIMLAGFVEARSGRFQFADINGIAAAPDLDARTRRACIAGAALASVAMPVFFQQVQVAGQTYFDGGVRQSVFATFVQRAIQEQMDHGRRGLPLLVLRNGPTDMDADDKANRKLNAVDAALRAEAILVNQLEVNSVASLRLRVPTGQIGFASADGWREQRLDPADAASPTCLALKAANKDAQFAPQFMRCLMAYGDRRARETQIWLPLIELEQASGPGSGN